MKQTIKVLILWRSLFSSWYHHFTLSGCYGVKITVFVLSVSKSCYTMTDSFFVSIAVFPADSTDRKTWTPTPMTFRWKSDRLTICYFKNSVGGFCCFSLPQPLHCILFFFPVMPPYNSAIHGLIWANLAHHGLSYQQNPGVCWWADCMQKKWHLALDGIKKRTTTHNPH